MGGDLRATASTYATIDPTTEETLAEVPDAGAPDVEDAVRAARDAAPGPRATSAWDRGRVVRTIAEIALAHAEELATLDALDLGSPYLSMLADVHRGADALEMFAGWALNLTGETVPASARHLHYTVREPYGVVARILPFQPPGDVRAVEDRRTARGGQRRHRQGGAPDPAVRPAPRPARRGPRAARRAQHPHRELGRPR